jgi:hypothetical protein
MDALSPLEAITIAQPPVTQETQIASVVETLTLSQQENAGDIQVA